MLIANAVELMQKHEPSSLLNLILLLLPPSYQRGPQKIAGISVIAYILLSYQDIAHNAFFREWQNLSENVRPDRNNHAGITYLHTCIKLRETELSQAHQTSESFPFSGVVEAIPVAPRQRYYFNHSSLKVAVPRQLRSSVGAGCSLGPSRSSSVGLGTHFQIRKPPYWCNPVRSTTGNTLWPRWQAFGRASGIFRLPGE